MAHEKSAWVVSLSVAPSANGLWAVTTFANVSQLPLALYKWNACIDSQIHNDIFEITYESGSVSYTGRLVKRGEPKAEDFVTVMPGEKLSCKANLAASYAFPSSKHRYEVHYAALNPHLGRPGFDSLKSNVVRFEYTALEAELVAN